MSGCCPGCGRVDMAGITHVCPPVDNHYSVHVNQAARQDTVGVMLRQKQTLDRVSAVLCDGLDWPEDYWRGLASNLEKLTKKAWPRLRAIADLIEQENL